MTKFNELFNNIQETLTEALDGKDRIFIDDIVSGINNIITGLKEKGYKIEKGSSINITKGRSMYLAAKNYDAKMYDNSTKTSMSQFTIHASKEIKDEHSKTDPNDFTSHFELIIGVGGKNELEILVRDLDGRKVVDTEPVFIKRGLKGDMEDIANIGIIQYEQTLEAKLIKNKK